MQIFPQSTRVLLEPIPEEEGALIMPDGVFKDEDGNDRDPLCRWRVCAKGPGKRLDDGSYEPIPLEIGDEIVMDGRFASRMTPIAWYGGNRYVLVEYGAILAKIAREPGEKVGQPAAPSVVKVARAFMQPPNQVLVR